MRICHLSSVHKRYDIRIFQKECVSLARKYKVAYIVADGRADEVKEKVNIIDVGAKGGRINRMLNTTRKIYSQALDLDFDIYHFHDPELMPTGLKLIKKGKKVIYDAHEDLPRQIMSKPYLKNIAKPLLAYGIEKYENLSASKLNGIITATPFIRNRFKKINLNTLDINNYPILGELSSENLWDEKDHSIAYVGGISKIRGIEVLVHSLKFTNENVKLNLAGKFSESDIEVKVKSLSSWSKVKELGMIGRNEVKNVLSKSIAGIVTFLPEPNHIDAQPNKMFEYMSAGIPVIGSHFPLWKNIIEGNNCGICVDPEKPEELANAINYLSTNLKKAQLMGRNGKNAVENKYNWKIEESKLYDFYENIIMEK